MRKGFKQKNWAGNYTYDAVKFHHPTSVEDVQEVVRRCKEVKVLGARHSFNSIADTAGDMISLEHLASIVSLDQERRTVTVEGGGRYGPLCQFLYRHGYALHNLASLPHTSVAGACATATHGSGDDHGNLATAVSALELITADGNLLTLSREQHGDLFQGTVVALGGLGVVTKITLDLLPSFEMRQDVYENLSFERLAENLDAIFVQGYSVSLFTKWQGRKIDQVWVKSHLSDNKHQLEPEWFGAMLAPSDRHPIPTISAVNCTKQMGVPGPWHERLPHFRMDYTPSSGEELQSEYLLPRCHALAALEAIGEISGQIAPLLQISELRTVASDSLWMSPCYQQACLAVHFTWKKDWAAVKKLLLLIEAKLEPFDARPHWGKLFTMSPTRLRLLYDRLSDFQGLLQLYDPQGKFRNRFLSKYLFGEDG